MAYYKVKIKRCFNTPKVVVVSGKNSQQAIRAAAVSLRAEGVTDANGLEILGRVKGWRGDT